MELIRFLERGITPWHTCRLLGDELRAAGFEELAERNDWTLRRGGAYFVTRGASLIAFRVGGQNRFALSACHTDSPGFRLKQSPDRAAAGACVALTEPYGGAVRHTWTDRPLGVAGVVMTAAGSGAERRLVDLPDDFVIPSLAIHYRRDVNRNCALDPAIDLDLISARTVAAQISEAMGADAGEILATELFVYCRQAAFSLGGDLVCAPRADDLISAAAMTEAILRAETPAAIPVAFFATHEEVGSQSYGGAGGTMLADTLARIAAAVGGDLRRMLADSLMLSVDNAHAVHPLHPELARDTDSPVLGGGVVIKHNAEGRYTTDAESAAAVRALAKHAGVPTQSFAMRSDLPCGSTLGVIATSQVSVRSADIGVAQLAMHAACETFSVADCAALGRLLTAFDESAFRFDGDIAIR